ncbi:MAG TPA: hypothetical protein VM536_02975 [Chloroflexia bacterium]|nr:hypothetical protein [Chloroflexia bacterium]
MRANRQQWCGYAGWTPREFGRNLALGFPAKKSTGSRGDTWHVDTVEGIAWIVAQEPAERGLDAEASAPLDLGGAPSP